MTARLEDFLPAQLSPAWQLLVGEQGLTALAVVAEHLQNRDDSRPITPHRELIMRAFTLEPHDVEVMIIGQDPYPTPGMASGVAFSVDRSHTRLPASLRNIRSELSSDCGVRLPDHGDLDAWSQRGVLLLNRHLTTVEGEPGAHHGIGWDHFTRAVVQGIARLRPHCVVVLWGKQAQELAPDCGDLALVTSAHPSPLSAHRGFFGSRPFTAVNTLRGAASLPPLDWSLGEES